MNVEIDIRIKEPIPGLPRQDIHTISLGTVKIAGVSHAIVNKIIDALKAIEGLELS